MVRPDRRPVLHAFGVVPHAVGVDDRARRRLGDSHHAAVDMVRHAGDHVLWRGPEPGGRPVLRTSSTLPPMPPEVTMTAPAGTRNRRATPRPDCSPRSTVDCFQHLARDAGDSAIGLDQPARPVAELQVDQTVAPRARARAGQKARARPAPCPRSGESAAPNCRGHAPGRRRARPSRPPETSACPADEATAAFRRRRNRRMPRRPCAARNPPRGRTAPNPSSPAAPARGCRLSAGGAAPGCRQRTARRATRRPARRASSRPPARG